ncbi:InlB B-repeat-containing protein [Clostridium grantii]|uniref:Listeria/Bacterioides repeat-containing protein n=1 Tax=Clostridium grantii DSM 8605 TaxID=1121316 RepID=A0A1M5T273_9CLOT|nr:InlB B-repeat-containing protein [Clostridium grantii]SHH44778.1 Listeria/Bacterioides repeat-containing protein [Clostridium grantii DSM 8605]
MKKRILSFLLVVCMILSIMPMSALATNVLWGDVNGDKKINLKDVLLLKQYIAGYENDIDKAAADINSDGVINEEDMLLMKQYIAGWDMKLGPEVYTIAFNSNGGSSISSVQVIKGDNISEVLSPKKDNAIFLGWYEDENFKNQFYAESPINSSMTLYAKYADIAKEEQFVDDSFSLMDQQSNIRFELYSSDANMTAEQVKENLLLEIVDNSEYVNLQVTGGKGTFSVSAEDGFTEGSSYKLTLVNDAIKFADKEVSFRNCTFTIKKEEVINISLNEDMIYIKSGEISQITKKGQPMESLSLALLGNKEEATIEGTFDYANAANLKIGDVLCIYKTTKPNERNTTDDYSEDTIAYVNVTAINGITVSYKNTDAEDVLFLPDTLPFKEDELTTYNPEGSFTVDKDQVDFSVYAELGLDKDTTVDKGDFVVIMETDNEVLYGQIESITSNDDIMTVNFSPTTEEAIQDITLDYYTTNDTDGETMLEDVDVDELQAQIEKETIDSGFAHQAMRFLASAATQTDGFSEISGVEDFIITDKMGEEINLSQIAGARIGSEYNTENINVEVQIDNKSQHFGKGIQCSVKVSGEVSLNVGEENEIIIQLSATFVQEVKMSVNANGKAVWKQTDWWPNLYYIGDYQMKANIDIYNYTGISIKAVVSSAQKEEEGKLDISEELKSLMEEQDEEEITAGVQNLFEAYGEMLENETDYISIIDQNLVDAQGCVDPFNIFAYSYKMDFVVSANINLALGCNFEYQSGTRYCFWFKIREKNAGSSSMPLIDETYAFQFYAMGELGIRAGLQLEFAIGLFSTKLDSVGVGVEVGAYTEMFGYFFYDLKSVNNKRTSKMVGALYLEFGIYLEIAFKAQVLNGNVSYNPTVYEEQWPLLYAGDEINVYDFAYEQPEKDNKELIKDITTYPLPQEFRNMSCLNLTEGDMFQEVYDNDRFYYTLSNKNFVLKDGIITVTVPENIRYQTCDLTITWKSAKLAFSMGDLKRTIHLVWTNLTDTELKEQYSVSVMAGDKIIWSERVNKGEIPVLPTEEEVLELIGYDKKMDGQTNLKYTGYTGYEEEAILASENKIYNFGVTEKEYTLTIEGIQKPDGTKENKNFTANFGENFDLSALDETGTSIPGKTYTRYLTAECSDVVNGRSSGNAIDVVFAKQLLANNYKYTAKYEENSCVVTYRFKSMDGKVIEPVTEIVKKGTIPVFDYSEYLLNQGQGYIVTNWDKNISRVTNDTTFTGECGEPTGEKYTITFDSNGGSKVNAIQRYKGTVVNPPVEPTKVGYTFDGWCSDLGLTKAYSFDKMPGNSFTLYAKWKVNQYTVSFNANGGEVRTLNKQVNYDKAYEELPMPTRKGYIFNGWFTAVDGGSQVAADTMVKITAPQTLYAQWKKKSVITGIDTAVQSNTYNGSQISFDVKGTTIKDFTVMYKKPGDTDWSDSAINAGKYAVKISREEDDTYAAYELVLTDTLIINKKSRTVTAPTSGTALYKTVSVEPVTDFEAYGDGAVEYAVSKTTTAPENGWTTSLSIVNLDANTNYYMFARATEGDNYLSATSIASSITVKTENVIPNSTTNHTVGVRTANNKNAGTDANVKFTFLYGDNTRGSQYNLNGSGNDFEKGDYRDYSVPDSRDPWMISGMNIGNDGKHSAAGWECDYVMLNIFGQKTTIQVDRWFDNQWQDYSTTAFKRNITATGDFDSWEGDNNVDSTSTGNISYTYNGNVTDQYGTYNALAHDDAPVISVIPSQTGYYDCFTYNINSFTIDKKALYEKMIQRGDEKIEFTVTMSFNPRSSNTTEFTKTVTINR